MRIPVVTETDRGTEPADTDTFMIVAPQRPGTMQEWPAPKPASSSQDE